MFLFPKDVFSRERDFQQLSGFGRGAAIAVGHTAFRFQALNIFDAVKNTCSRVGDRLHQCVFVIFLGICRIDPSDDVGGNDAGAVFVFKGVHRAGELGNDFTVFVFKLGLRLFETPVAAFGIGGAAEDLDPASFKREESLA